MADPIDTAAIPDHRRGYVVTDDGRTVDDLCDEVDRLRSKVAEALDWAEKHQAEVDRLRAEIQSLTLHSLGCSAAEEGDCEFTEHGTCLNRSLWSRVHAAETENAKLRDMLWGLPRG